MSKRTAKFSPNSECPDPRTKQKCRNDDNRIYAPPSTSTPKPGTSSAVVRPSTSGTAVHPTPGAGVTPSTSDTGDQPKTPSRMETSNDEFNDADDTLQRSGDRFEDSMSKKLHNSMSKIPNETNIYSAPRIEYVVVEINRKDDNPFDAILPTESLKQLWTTLGRKLAEVKVLSFERHRNKYLRVVYNIRDVISIADITHSYELQAEITANHASAIYNLRFPQFKELVCQLGQVITVTFHRVPPEVSCKDLRLWLQLFGTVKGGFR
jgi:hypothetical protein